MTFASRSLLGFFCFFCHQVQWFAKSNGDLSNGDALEDHRGTVSIGGKIITNLHFLMEMSSAKTEIIDRLI